MFVEYSADLVHEPQGCVRCFRSKAPCCNRAGYRHCQAPLLQHAWKASGTLGSGGTSWDLLLGAKQTGLLVTACSFSGVTAHAGYNLSDASIAEILPSPLSHFLFCHRASLRPWHLLPIHRMNTGATQLSGKQSIWYRSDANSILMS